MPDNYVPDAIPRIIEPAEPTPKRPPASNNLTDLNRHIGSRIRLGRTIKGFTLQELSERIGLTYQQIHKYERGQSRIAAGRLVSIARVLGVTPSWFFEGTNAQEDNDQANQAERQSRELSHSFATIRDDKILKALARMVRIIAEVTASPTRNDMTSDRGAPPVPPMAASTHSVASTGHIPPSEESRTAAAISDSPGWPRPLRS